MEEKVYEFKIANVLSTLGYKNMNLVGAKKGSISAMYMYMAENERGQKVQVQVDRHGNVINVHESLQGFAWINRLNNHELN